MSDQTTRMESDDDSGLNSSPVHYHPDDDCASENSSENSSELMNDEANRSIRELARTLSRQSQIFEDNADKLEKQDSRGLSLSRTLTNFRTRVANNRDTTEPRNPIEALDSELDPNSPEFSSVEWAKNMYRVFQSDTDKFKPREMGVAYKNLSVYGFGTDADYQTTVYNAFLKGAAFAKNAATGFRNRKRVDILHSMDGVVQPGELVVVLGRPGAGCSTFLKSIAQNTYGFHINEDTELNYQGLTPKDVVKHFRGDAVYSAESETHFPHLTVGQTLLLAAKMRTPANRFAGVSREEYALHMRDVIMATFGLSHTVNTKVGSDLVRGVSGGERKRVSIAELALSGAPLQCWDNSTRGLDSATALEFVRTLKCSARVFNNTSFVAVYQSSEEMYELFDKVVLMYEGHQIFFGTVEDAKTFFLDMGYEYKPRQPTPDFLTSLTSPSERIARKGFEDKVPRTPEEFEKRWRESKYYAKLQMDLDKYMADHPAHGEDFAKFKDSYNSQQMKRVSHRSPFMVSFPAQVKYLVTRGYQRMRGDFSMQFTTIFGNSSMALILSSMFYNLPSDTESFYRRSALLFFAILFNAFSSMLEIFSLYEARPVVDKHRQYSLYHPAAEAMASIVTEFPSKVLVSLAFNLVLYFMSNLRRTPGNFFAYLLFSFTATLSMSHLFRTIGTLTRSLQEAMVPATVLLLALVIYTGFVIPTKYMHGWARWINYLNPVGYSFESLMANEFHNRNFTCSNYIPEGPGYNISSLPSQSFICQGTGAIAGQNYIEGDLYLELSFNYSFSHMWRNWGIVMGFVFFFLGTYLLGVWLNPGLRSKGEVLVFPRSVLRRLRKERRVGNAAGNADVESGTLSATPPGSMLKGDDDGGLDSEESSLHGIVETSNDIFYWQDVCYDIKIKGEDRRILDNVDGWVKPGTLTALMGASGAGKTTLLDTLANRVTMGVVTGEMFVNGTPRDMSFQRSTGYAQQQDLHLETATVREALTFSALLRQPREIPRAEKIAYVDNVLKILEMEAYADAIVGVPGEGLNVEQRKRLTIGVELAAKPKLLLFLDEPTSGLDSQTAWSICQLMKKLSKAGQAILCTIHQPSAMLLQEFDRLLFLARGGRTVYFGEIGENSKTLTGYFERNGAEPCAPEANPAEWMLHVIGAAPGSKANRDYVEVWNNSPEKQAVKEEIARLKKEFNASDSNVAPKDKVKNREFAMPLWYQYILVTTRVFQQYWRTPSYIWSKLFLAIVSGLFNGFSFFKADNTIQGLQNLMFSVFMFFMVFNSSVQQLVPFWVNQRNLYEVRERPSKIFSWQAFVGAQITAELPWQVLAAVLSFFCWYYPIGFYTNAGYTDSVNSRGGLMFFFVLLFFIYISTMGQMCIAGIELADTASNVASLLFTMALTFCGVLVTKEAMPGFWVFMYRVSPFTYLVAGMLATGVAQSPVTCSAVELVHLDPPTSSMTCLEFLGSYANMTAGNIINPSATSDCQFCSISNSDVYLASVGISFDQRWRNLGIFLCYPAFHIAAIFFLYWLARVPKKKDRVKH